MNLKQLIGWIGRIVVGGVLMYAGASKALGPSAEFAAALAAYKILPTGILPTLALAWPWLELLVGTYLFFGYYTRPFAAVAAAMFAVFLAIVVISMIRGIDPGSCGCFGIGFSFSIRQTAMLDSALLLLALLLTFASKDPLPYSADAWIEKRP